MSTAIAIRHPHLIINPIVFRWNFNLRILILPVFLLIIFLLAFFILQINRLTAENYLISDYETKITNLSQENKSLEIKSVRSNSLENIDGLVAEMGFEKSDSLQYVKIFGGSMAVK